VFERFGQIPCFRRLSHVALAKNRTFLFRMTVLIVLFVSYMHSLHSPLILVSSTGLVANNFALGLMPTGAKHLVMATRPSLFDIFPLDHLLHPSHTQATALPSICQSMLEAGEGNSPLPTSKGSLIILFMCRAWAEIKCLPSS
jgi:hypothetical protein